MGAAATSAGAVVLVGRGLREVDLVGGEGCEGMGQGE